MSPKPRTQRFPLHMSRPNRFQGPAEAISYLHANGYMVMSQTIELNSHHQPGLKILGVLDYLARHGYSVIQEA
jgi:hypothetical protein